MTGGCRGAAGGVCGERGGSGGGQAGGESRGLRGSARPGGGRGNGARRRMSPGGAAAPPITKSLENVCPDADNTLEMDAVNLTLTSLV